MLTKTLENLGLTDKEAKVYLANLEIGPNPVSKIALKAKLNRVTTYDILEKLLKKDLVNFVIKREIKYFQATDPETVITDFKRKSQELEAALPELKQLRGEIETPKVIHLEGLEAIKRVFKDIIQSQNEVFAIANQTELVKLWAEFNTEFSQKREREEIRQLTITNDTSGLPAFTSKERICHIQPEVLEIKDHTFIYGNKTAIFSLSQNPTAVVIENQIIADSKRNLFQLLWNSYSMDTNQDPSQNQALLKDRKSSALKPSQSDKTIVPQATVLENQASLF